MTQALCLLTNQGLRYVDCKNLLNKGFFGGYSTAVSEVEAPGQAY